MATHEKDFVENRALYIENASRDSPHDEIAEEAKGGELSELPSNYYWNWRFLGSLTAVVFMAQGLYLGEWLVPKMV